VVARATRLLFGSTFRSVTVPAIRFRLVVPSGYVAVRMAGADQVPPPSLLRVMPGCCTSKGSPNPRKRMSGFEGSIASVPTAVLPRASVRGSQRTVGAVAVYVFHTPPPAVEMKSTSGSIGCARIWRTRPESISLYWMPLTAKSARVGPRLTNAPPEVAESALAREPPPP